MPRCGGNTGICWTAESVSCSPTYRPRSWKRRRFAPPDYVFSMTSIAGLKGLDRDALRVCFEKRMDADGVLRIPKEYGMFLCTR